MKGTKKLLSLFIASCIVVSMLSVPVFALTDYELSQNISSGTYSRLNLAPESYSKAFATPEGENFNGKTWNITSGTNTANNETDGSISAEGRTGSANNDYAYKVTAKDYTTTFSYADSYSMLDLITADGLDDNINNRQGNFVIEFDVKADTTTSSLGMQLISLWNREEDIFKNWDILSADGTVKGSLDPDTNEPYRYPAGKWMHFKMSLSKADKWNVYVTEDGMPEKKIVDNGDSVNIQVDKNRIRMYFAQSVAGTSEADKMGFTIDNFKMYDELGTNSIVSPDADKVYAGDKVTLSAAVNTNNAVKFYLDDTLVSSFAAQPTKELHKYTSIIDGSKFDAGKKEFKVVELVSGVEKVVLSKKVSFTGRYKLVIDSDDGEGASTHGINDGIYPYDVETFENDFVAAGCWKMCRYSDHIHSQGTDSTTFYINDDEDSDGKYLLLESNAAVGPTGRYLTFASKGSGDNTVSMVPAQLGIWEMEFDIKMSSDAGAIGFRGFPLWGTYTNDDSINGIASGSRVWNEASVFLTPEGTIRGTDVTYSRNEWHHFKLNYDNRAATTAANGGKGIWNVWMDGTQVVTNTKDNATYSGSNKRNINMYFMDGYKDGAATLGSFGLDNLAISRQDDMPEFVKTEFAGEDGVYAEATSIGVPTGTKYIRLTLDKALDSYSEGDIICQGATSNYSDKLVTLTLSDTATAGQKIKLETLIKNASGYGDKKLTETINVYEPVLKLKDLTVADGKASLNIFNTIGEDIAGTLYIAVYNSYNELIDLYADLVTAGFGDNIRENISVKSGNKYKAMFWDGSTLKPFTPSV